MFTNSIGRESRRPGLRDLSAPLSIDLLLKEKAREQSTKRQDKCQLFSCEGGGGGWDKPGEAGRKERKKKKNGRPAIAAAVLPMMTISDITDQ